MNPLAYLALIRPKQWVKNLLVFAPAFFAGALLDAAIFNTSLLAFVAFSLAASAVYVVNDIIDREQDRAHPRKKERPIASGRVSIREAYVLTVALLIPVAAILAYAPPLIPVIAGYMLLNALYSAWLKHVAVIDILLVSAFYLLRLAAGSAVTLIPLSPWIILCAFFFALFVIVGKRRAELRHESRRRVLEEYSKEALDYMLAASAGLAIVSYSLYTVIGREGPYLIWSTLFVVAAIFEAMNRMYRVPDEAEAPEKLLLKDPVMLVSFFLWGICVLAAFYFA